MSAPPVTCFFRLGEDGLRCGTDGLFVGGTPLLDHGPNGWEVRPLDGVEAELAALYGLPIDLSAKADDLATIAAALDCGDGGLAAIAAALLGFPDPSALGREAPARGSAELAAQLAASGLLKGRNSLRPTEADVGGSAGRTRGRWRIEARRVDRGLASSWLRGARRDGAARGFEALK